MTLELNCTIDGLHLHLHHLASHVLVASTALRTVNIVRAADFNIGATLHGNCTEGGGPASRHSRSRQDKSDLRRLKQRYLHSLYHRCLIHPNVESLLPSQRTRASICPVKVQLGIRIRRRQRYVICVYTHVNASRKMIDLALLLCPMIHF